MRLDDEEEKNSLLKNIICFALILNFIFFIWGFFFMNSFMHDYTPLGPPSLPTTLLVGTIEDPKVLDPLMVGTEDSSSKDVLIQVVECLFWYNLTDPALPLEPLLAKSHSWDVSNTKLTVTVKDNIYFHDGCKLDSYAVKWNLDRILYFTNATGDLPPATAPAPSSSIYFMPDGITPIINHTELVDAMTVKIVLNQPFASFLPLLSYTGSSLISPTAHSNTEYIDLNTERIVGTGSYVYSTYSPDVEVRFYRWYRYHGDTPYFERLTFIVIDETASRCQAMLDHTVDVIFGFEGWACHELEYDPYTTIVETGPDLIYWYMAFDNYRINTTWRETISKAVKYSYIIDEIWQGSAVRGPPCVPSGMPGHNSSVTVAQYNIPEARMIMQSMGFGKGWDVGSQIGSNFTPGAHEVNWSDSTFFTDAFGHPLDVNYHSGSGFNRDLNDLLNYYLDKIGIETIETTRTWEEFENDGENGLLRGIWYAGLAPSYIDAFTMLDPLFNPALSSSFCNLTDPQVLAWLADAAVETNITKRYELFGNLQYRLFEVLYAHIPLFATLGRTVHGIDIQSYPYNQLGIFLAWPIYRGTA
jgi:ABC-type transport system substrate-binding protein